MHLMPFVRVVLPLLVAATAAYWVVVHPTTGFVVRMTGAIVIALATVTRRSRRRYGTWPSWAALSAAASAAVLAGLALFTVLSFMPAYSVEYHWDADGNETQHQNLRFLPRLRQCAPCWRTPEHTLEIFWDWGLLRRHDRAAFRHRTADGTTYATVRFNPTKGRSVPRDIRILEIKRAALAAGEDEALLREKLGPGCQVLDFVHRR